VLIHVVSRSNIQPIDTLVPFTGVLRSVQTTNLAPDNFVSIPAGSTFETNINAASLHDLSAGGSFTLVAEGAIPYALANSTELSGSAVAFKSNTLTLEVDGATAAAVPRALNSIDRRAAIQSGCSTSQRSATAVALTNCRSLSTAAAIAARSGSSTKFSEYFRTTSSSTRITVANRFTAVASECRSSSSGATYYYCTDVYGYCESNVLAYTIPATG
jgi:deuterolysin